MEIYNLTKQSFDGAVTWNTSVSAITGYRTDLARGITAAQVPYSAVAAEMTTVSPNLSSINATTTFTVLTAITTAE
jgi:hypothetical protein